MRSRIASTLVLAFLALFISACLETTRTIPTSPPQNPAYTSAAETIVAQLTQVADASTDTPPPAVTQGNTPQPSEDMPAET